MSRERLVTLPNAVSMSRLLLAAMFVAVRDPVLRFSLLLIASGTDFLDGWLARRSHATTRSGALIDPIADRFFIVTAVSVYLADGAITIGAYFTLLARDIATLMAVIAMPAAVPSLVVGVGVTSVASIADYTLMLWRERAT